MYTENECGGLSRADLDPRRGHPLDVLITRDGEICKNIAIIIANCLSGRGEVSGLLNQGGTEIENAGPAAEFFFKLSHQNNPNPSLLRFFWISGVMGCGLMGRELRLGFTERKPSLVS